MKPMDPEREITVDPNPEPVPPVPEPNPQPVPPVPKE
jgi:hypothetical protein